MVFIYRLRHSCKLFRVPFMLSRNPLDRLVVIWYAVAVLDSWTRRQEVRWWCPGCFCMGHFSWALGW